MDDFYYVQNYMLSTGDRILVPKSDLSIIKHHAVYLGYDVNNCHYIIENVIGIGVRLIGVSDFFIKNPIISRIEHYNADSREQSRIIKCAISKLGTPYNLFTYNCESFANDVLQKKADSSQLEIALVLILLILGMTIAYKIN